MNIRQNGKPVVFHQLRYQGRTTINIIGIWCTGFKQLIGVMTDLAPEQAVSIYLVRTKIEQSFRDLKSLQQLDKLMNKQQQNMEKMVALMMIAYALGVLVGEAIRDHQYPVPGETQAEVFKAKGKARQLYSGLFFLLKQGIDLTADTLSTLISQVLNSFAKLVWGHVRTLV